MVTTKGNLAEFCFYRPQAKKVCILGDFNGWRDGELNMVRTPEGNWVARIFLPAGDFKFRYRADGQWFIDYAAFGIECGEFGLDSVVRIGAGPAQQSSSRPARTSARGAISRDRTSRTNRRSAVA
ncbi:MAG: hypothetical protein ACE15C_06120 [Phycisphaerae bacterium]